MTIAPAILREYPKLADNEAQQKIVAHDTGPLLVIAGPGSGKTFSLIMRSMNLLLQGRARPREIVLCTFTEKAAYQLRDGLAAAARKLGYEDDLSELRATTIHGYCNRLLQTHRHRTTLGSNFETLDDLTQLLFLYEHFMEVVGRDAVEPYLGRWKRKWDTIEGLRDYFNKITEELVDSTSLVNSQHTFLMALGRAYQSYTRLLEAHNRLDFAHQQKRALGLLADGNVGPAVTAGIKYVMVDEYQDTNYIQEQLLLKLVEQTGNLCVVGDEDQSLYRFRGATVRNILEFPQRLPNTEVIKLTTNYRSPPRIIRAFDHWMASADWANPDGQPFRYDKTIQPAPDTDVPDYPAVFSIWGQDEGDEAERFADLVAFLKEREVVSDFSQVALLLHSVRGDHSARFLAALEARGIKSFCPRARRYFDSEEVRLMVACYALILGYHGEGRGELHGRTLQGLAKYVDDCIVDLARGCALPHPLAGRLQGYAAEIAGLGPRQGLDKRPSDYLYELLAFEPFISLVRNENRARNLAVLSQLINAFQNYYHYTVITHKNREYIRFHFFNSFLRLLYDGGINEYEDPNQPFPKGHVQVMTIHQAKGLEFPVVVVGSLTAQLSTKKHIDRDLGPFYNRPPYEPESRVTDFDRMRLHYVAFSRAEKVLVLTAHAVPKARFAPIWQGLPQWPYVERELLAAQSFLHKERVPLKRKYSFTGDIRLYETCPRQYQYFREYDFTPSRSAVIFFGLLVHQTIESVHRVAMDGGLDALDETAIRAMFEREYSFLTLSDVRAIGPKSKEAAFRQVMDYVRQNQDEMRRVIETEVDVSLEKEGYILTGKVDLLMGGDGKLEVLDFKTSPKPKESPELLSRYEHQLCTYAHILQRRHGKYPDRLMVYWTSEPRKEDAIVEFAYRPELVDSAGRHFDEVVARIQDRDFGIVVRPEKKICKECDLKSLCRAEGVIRDE
ncbi:ATP-dependent helicase [candidate division WOR-3 bacterium]|nr:ATP-dependent helicase [candidate division WOR-3 bacterium]